MTTIREHRAPVSGWAVTCDDAGELVAQPGIVIGHGHDNVFARQRRAADALRVAYPVIVQHALQRLHGNTPLILVSVCSGSQVSTFLEQLKHAGTRSFFPIPA